MTVSLCASAGFVTVLGDESTQLLDRRSPFGVIAKNIERVRASHL